MCVYIYIYTHTHTQNIFSRVDHHDVLEVWPHKSNTFAACLKYPILMII